MPFSMIWYWLPMPSDDICADAPSYGRPNPLACEVVFSAVYIPVAKSASI